MVLCSFHSETQILTEPGLQASLSQVNLCHAKNAWLGSRNSCFCDKVLKYLVNFKMPQFLKETASHPHADAAGPLQTGAESPHHHMCEQRGFQSRKGRCCLRSLCRSGIFLVQQAFVLSKVHLSLPNTKIYPDHLTRTASS